jgi:ligand-binding sensor domain-containing protein
MIKPKTIFGPFILLITFTTFAFAASAQHLQAIKNPKYSVFTWPFSSKLSQSSVTDTLIAKNGIMWIATLDGINRYDGDDLVEYRTYKTGEESIDSANILKILENDAGNIIAVSRDAGLLIYSQQKNNFYPLINPDHEEHPTDKIYSAFIDKNRTLWLGYESGRIRKFSHSLEKFFELQVTQAGYIISFTQSNDGELYAASTDGQIFRIDSTSNKYKKIFPTASCSAIPSNLLTISVDEKKTLWLGSRGEGLYQLDVLSKDCRKLPLKTQNLAATPNTTINQIFHDKKFGTTWIATDEGLYSYDKSMQRKLYNTNNSNISDDEVISLYLDKDGTYWVGTYSGLNYLIPTSIEFFGPGTEEDLNSIVAIEQSKRHGTWIATYGGLFKYSSQNNNHIRFDQVHPDIPITNTKIMSMFMDEDSIWLGHRSTGLEHYSFSKNKLVLYDRYSDPALSSNSVSSILKVKSGELFVGTYGGGLNIFSPDMNSVKHDLKGYRVITLFQSKDETIWIGTESGLFWYNPKNGLISRQNFEATIFKSITMPIFWALAESRDSDLWLGTMHHGLFVWPRSAIMNQDSSQISPIHFGITNTKTIYGIEIDNQGNVWCSTNSGLIRITPSNLDSKLISTHHGVQNQEFDFAVSHKDSEGLIYFGGRNGYTKFSPSKIRFDTKVPKLKLTKLLLAGTGNISADQIQMLKSLQLTYKNYFITFEFSVLDFIDPENNQFRYKLENFDPDWIDIGHNRHLY